jgi:hypothetical protein
MKEKSGPKKKTPYYRLDTMEDLQSSKQVKPWKQPSTEKT